MNDNRQGGLGAMMDEYERAAADLIEVLSHIETARFVAPIAGQAEHTQSIQAIMEHVVYAGYGYANYLRKLWEIPDALPKHLPANREEAIAGLQKMLAYTSETFEGHWTMSEEEADATTFVVSWGVQYSVEQLLEHAIVHILRHRRQIERILKP